MPRTNLSEYKTLTAFLRGYLHQDFRLDYKTPRAAIEAYCREATPNEIAHLKSELDRFLHETQALPFDAVQKLLIGELGSGWLPKDREDLSELSSALQKQ